MADKIIIFSGKQYSGKDTAAKIMLEAMPEYKRCAMGDIIKITYGKQKNLSFDEIEKNKAKIKFILIGLISLSMVTFILFNLSKIGIDYPNEDIMKEIRKIALLLFIPINGFLTLPHIASIKTEIQLGAKEEEKIKRKIILIAIVWILAIIIETIYLKDFQKGIIQIINTK